MFVRQVHRDQIVGEWLCCEPCSKYFPDDNVMSLHNSHTHNKAVRDTIEEQLEEMEAGEGGLKLVSEVSVVTY